MCWRPPPFSWRDTVSVDSDALTPRTRLSRFFRPLDWASSWQVGKFIDVPGRRSIVLVFGGSSPLSVMIPTRWKGRVVPIDAHRVAKVLLIRWRAEVEDGAYSEGNLLSDPWSSPCHPLTQSQNPLNHARSRSSSDETFLGSWTCLTMSRGVPLHAPQPSKTTSRCPQRKSSASTLNASCHTSRERPRCPVLCLTKNPDKIRLRGDKVALSISHCSALLVLFF